MSSEDEMSFLSLESSNTAAHFPSVHKAEKEMVSLWPLNDEPKYWYSGAAPDWHKDPPHFAVLWEDGTDTKKPIHITPILPTNLFGRTAAEAFAGFPTYFDDSPPSSPSHSLSPLSPMSSHFSFDEETDTIGTNDSMDDMDEMTLQLADRMHLDDSPPQSPQPVSISPPLPSSPACDYLSINSLFDGFSSTSTTSTLSVGGTSSNTSSTYAVSPSPIPFTGDSSTSPPPRFRSPRRSSSPTIPKAQEGEPSPETYCALDLFPPAAPLIQIVLEEHPKEDPGRRPGIKRGSYEDDKDFESLVNGGNDGGGNVGRSRKNGGRAASKRYPCTVPGCTESFTRRNDMKRHVKNAAIHKGSVQQAEALANSPVCQFCGEELSRPDAARRHELKDSCGKRTIRRKSTYSMLPA
ncbi:hypothetical protein DFH08DRAFT_110700 [Mycena albidolilacea]|uniref:C2H2-type domain-containing protein n=1 Tax=Mycena albidolilacea TaxID=1033008 RepID=A0AAD7A699_9AGAR|nr:hypothetical protein DFH08DRAFT_110700 [Mycena albidolilacea]